jgi:hypothetical protein
MRLNVVFEVPQLKPEEDQAALAACVEAIMQTTCKNARIISAFDL